MVAIKLSHQYMPDLSLRTEIDVALLCNDAASSFRFDINVNDGTLSPGLILPSALPGATSVDVGINLIDDLLRR